ncbi:Hnrnpu, partial [Symbiodinium microadriaticum]
EQFAPRFALGRDQTVAVLLNLDGASPNKNTVSLFKDGVRVAQPQKLPEALVGKTLFPHVCFKNMTLHVNFASPLTPLAFKCYGVSEAPVTDAVAAAKPKDEKFEVLFPVGVPDEGTFDWLDDFLAKNPKFVELSDRAILKWAEKSGFHCGEGQPWKHCNDKPDVQFRVPYLDDFSARRMIQAVAPLQPRNYVVMEVKSNLIKEEREQLIKRFADGCYKTVAQVVMGEPPADFKEKVHKELLAEKQEKVTQEWKKRKAEREQERIARKRQKELEEAIRFESFFNVGRESLAACAFQGLGSPSNGTADGLAF